MSPELSIAAQRTSVSIPSDARRAMVRKKSIVMCRSAASPDSDSRTYSRAEKKELRKQLRSKRGVVNRKVMMKSKVKVIIGVDSLVGQDLLNTFVKLENIS